MNTEARLTGQPNEDTERISPAIIEQLVEARKEDKEEIKELKNELDDLKDQLKRTHIIN